MLRLTKLTNQYKKRTLRVVYGNTQAYPYGLTLLSTFDRTAGQLSGGQAVSGAKSAILPGAVAIKVAGEIVTLAGSNSTAATGTQRSIGLFGNFVGGEMDELFDNAQVSVWRGAGSVYEILAPAFDDTGLAAAVAADVGDTAAHEAYMQCGADARLVLLAGTTASPYSATTKAIARVLDRLSANAIIVELLV